MWLAAFPIQAATLHVPGQHSTIQAAIDAAKPGDEIVVAPGTYHERIRLSKRVMLRSAGDDSPGKLGLSRAETTILDGGGAEANLPGVILDEGAVLDGFTVTRVGLFDQAEFDRHHATRGENLTNEQGAVAVEGALTAVEISGVTATVRHCIVHTNGHAGIGCSGAKNRSRIESNVTYANMGGGIGIALGAEPLVMKNRCFGNLRAGIGCRAAKGLIVENECYENVRAGIGIREGAAPIVRGNRCHGNRRAGIGNRMPGTSPFIVANECFGNGMAGIGTRDKASPLIRGNHCHKNRLAGIGAAQDSHPIIVGNRLHDNAAAALGFDACEGGTAVVLDNEIVAEDLVAIGIQAGWKVRAAGNKLKREGGMPPLVMVFDGAVAEFTGNRFEGSGVAGIRVAGVARVLGNTFVCPAPRKGGPPQFAIWALAGSEVAMGENEVEGWREELAADPKADVRRLNAEN